MADMILVEPFALTLAGAAGPPMAVSPGYYVNDSAGVGTGAANLVTNDPREVWQSTAGGTVLYLWIDLGADRLWDTLVLNNTNFDPASTMNLYYGTSAQANYFATLALNGLMARAPSEDVASTNGPAAIWLPTAINARYIFLGVYQALGSPQISIGNLLVGKSWKPVLGREFGSGRPPIDSGARERLSDGGLATLSGKLISGFKWVFGDLDAPDLAKLWGILRRRRTTEPMLLIEDPGAAVAEGIHYGTFVSLEAYERNDVTKSRWVVNFEDWL